MTAQSGGATSEPMAAAPAMPAAVPMAMPMRPPMRQTTMASVMNCMRISRRRAPSALRMPISRVRSVTVMSIMFITPIPPTSSEIPPIAASTRLIVVKIWLRDARSSLKSVTFTM